MPSGNAAKYWSDIIQISLWQLPKAIAYMHENGQQKVGLFTIINEQKHTIYTPQSNLLWVIIGGYD